MLIGLFRAESDDNLEWKLRVFFAVSAQKPIVLVLFFLFLLRPVQLPQIDLTRGDQIACAVVLEAEPHSFKVMARRIIVHLNKIILNEREVYSAFFGQIVTKSVPM